MEINMENTDKQLKDKAIKFKGKDYVLVSDRVNYFNENYNGSITTKLLSSTDSDMVIVQAIVTYFDDNTLPHKFTGMSQAKWSDTTSFVNKTSALENAETSAVGRALAFMGIGVIESIASIDEVRKAVNQEVKPVSTEPVREPVNDLEVFCAECNTKMLPFHGKSKATGKEFDAWRCPKDVNHKLRFI
jgi:hypothetical protein